MKLTVCILLFFTSIFCFGQGKDKAKVSQDIYSSISELTILDSLAVISITGKFSSNFEGLVGQSYTLDSSHRFIMTSFTELGGLTRRDSGTWTVIDRNIIRLISKKEIRKFDVLKFDQAMILVPIDLRRKFIADLRKAKKKADSQNLSTPSQINSAVVTELKNNYHLKII